MEPPDEGGPLYIGFDLSTQQLKGLVVTSSLKVIHVAKFDFDADSSGFPVENGVQTNEAEHEVFAPVAMWLQALDAVLLRLKEQGMDFRRVSAISGAGQQHGSVYWNSNAGQILATLDAGKGLEEQVAPALSHPYSPNWQDASTQRECDQFDEYLGSPAELAEVTGSKAHHDPFLEVYGTTNIAVPATSRISLVSSFLASLFLGKIAPFDISDVCGMNLWDIQKDQWNGRLLELCAGSYGVADLKQKLGEVPDDGGMRLGKINRYFVERYSFNPDCVITPSTGDNPATILALPLRSGDAVTPRRTFSTTQQHGGSTCSCCYKNGGLAREHIRDAINNKFSKDSRSPSTSSSNPWNNFNEAVFQRPAAGQKTDADLMKLGLFFPRPEIVPNLRNGEWRFNYDSNKKTLQESQQGWDRPLDDARAIVESQMLSLRLRSRGLVHSPSKDVPHQPRRVYLVGGGSRNTAIAKVAGGVLGGVEGVYKLDVGENACALGAAYKAAWALERAPNQTFEDLIGKRWKEEEFAEKIDEGYQLELFERFGKAVEGFEMMEKQILRQEGEGRSVG
ncbi:D-xylulose kinase [Histoplasma capsulatum var. duboisii H88]|uniref:Xylulose kinase n=1 Tax=Ajellomyces capsulatus (strain H88) TaxID=544711 RepID=F0UL12_AJEC8|nr:D-xylulose kinase [Histoplasma capsulatum var. duboisii H88]